jgi:hypothetical protein
MYAEISSAYASAKIALEIAKGANSLANYSELVAAVSEVNTKLMDATAVALSGLEKQAALTSEIADLKEKLREAENFQGKMQNYNLHELETGVFAYRYEPVVQSSEPTHYLCPDCVNNRIPTILQPGSGALHCHVCKTAMLYKHPEPTDFKSLADRLA